MDIPVHDVNEDIYIRLWQDNHRPGLATLRLRKILGREPNQRDALVAASLIQWFGSLHGLLCIEQARRLIKAALQKPNINRQKARAKAFKQAFSEIGRTAEYSGYTHLAAIVHHITLVRAWDKPVPVSTRDQYVANAVLTWLSSPPGTRFINEAERRISVKREEARTLPANPIRRTA